MLIAAVMLITGAEAYLASKIVAMVTAGLILVLLYKCFGKDAWQNPYPAVRLTASRRYPAESAEI